MSGKSSRPPMTRDELEQLAEPSGNRIYQGRQQTTEANRALVGEIVGEMAQQMEQQMDESRRFPLSDLESVNAVAMDYVAACARKGSLPTVSGLASALGRSRGSLYKFAEGNRAFADFLESFSDSCGECAAAAAIHGATAAIPTIFVLKSRHNWRDVVAIEAVQNKPGITDESAATVAARYAALPED